MHVAEALVHQLGQSGIGLGAQVVAQPTWGAWGKLQFAHILHTHKNRPECRDPWEVHGGSLRTVMAAGNHNSLHGSAWRWRGV